MKLRWCKHGFHPVGKCEVCRKNKGKDDSKKSDKYGGVTISIPPNMRAVK